MEYLKTFLFSLLLMGVSFGQSLTGVSPSATYGDLLHLNNSNNGITSSLQNIYDGKGGLTALQLSTLGIKSNGTLDVIGAVTFGSTLNIIGIITAPNVAYNNAWGIPRNGMKFDGVDDYVSVPNNINVEISDNAFSVSVYFSTTTTSQSALVSQYSAGPENGYFVGVTTSGVVRYELYNAAGSYQDINGTITVNDGKEHFIVVGHNNTDGFIYIDGILDKQTALSITPSISTTGAFTIGSRTTSIYCDSKIYQVKLNNHNLTQAEVTSRWNNGRPQDAEVPDKYVGGSQTELATNGTFTGNSTGWIEGTGWAYGTNNEVATTTSAALYQGSTLKINKSYRITYTINGYSAGSITTNLGSLAGISRSANGTYSDEYISIANSPNVALVPTGFTGAIDNVSVVEIGAVAEYLPQNFGSFGVVDSSPNRLNGNTSGSPIALSKGREVEYVDYKGSITGPTTLTDIVPAGYKLESILFENTTANAVTGGIKIGTTVGGTDVVTAGAVGTDATDIFTLAKVFFSVSTDQTLYVDAVTTWNSASINLTFRFRRVK